MKEEGSVLKDSFEPSPFQDPHHKKLYDHILASCNLNLISKNDSVASDIARTALQQMMNLVSFSSNSTNPPSLNPSSVSSTNKNRYRESYTRESLGASNGREGAIRVSILDPNTDPDLQDLSYETLSRNLDANLAEIDMDDFRSDDIHQLLTMPSVCGQCHVSEEE